MLRAMASYLITYLSTFVSPNESMALKPGTLITDPGTLAKVQAAGGITAPQTAALDTAAAIVSKLRARGQDETALSQIMLSAYSDTYSPASPGAWPSPPVSKGDALDALIGLIVGPTTGAQNTLVYSPLNPAPGKNVYATFPALYADYILTKGRAVVCMDGTFSGGTCSIPLAGMPVGGWDFQGRASFAPLNGNVPTIDIVDGAFLKSPGPFDDAIAVTGHGATVSPIQYDTTVDTVALYKHGPPFLNLGAAAMVKWSGAITGLSIFFTEGFSYDNSGGGGPFAEGVAGQSLTIIGFGPVAFFLGANGLVKGPLGMAGLTYVVDSDWRGVEGPAFSGQIPSSPFYLGPAATISYFSFGRSVAYDNSVPASLPSPGSMAAFPTLQTAIDSDTAQPGSTYGAAHVIDSGTVGIERTLYSSASGAGQNFTLPLAANWPGRRILIRDTTGVAGLTYTWVAGVGNTINGAATLGITGATARATEVESDGVSKWSVVSSSAI